MERVLSLILPIAFIVIGGYQAWRPEQLIRMNMNQRLNWTPKWMRRHALHPANVWSARLAGAIACVIGVVLLVKNVWELL